MAPCGARRRSLLVDKERRPIPTRSIGSKDISGQDAPQAFFEWDTEDEEFVLAEIGSKDISEKTLLKYSSKQKLDVVPTSRHNR